MSSNCSPNRVAKPSKVRLKCLVLGAAGAGKTSILRRYFYNKFQAGTRVPTLGSDFYTGRVRSPAGRENLEITLQIWDTPGRERFYLKRQRKVAASLSDSFFRHADSIMLVYDMQSSTSFTQLLKWYADLIEVFKEKRPPILIVANKLDVFKADQERNSMVAHPRQIRQRDVLGLKGDFRGNDFRYEYRVSPVTTTDQNARKNNRMEISSFLANRENWTTDWSYLDSLLNSEDASTPDREMVLLWCMRNGLKHMEISAASGEGVDTVMETLVSMALDTKTETDFAESLPPVNYPRNAKLNLQERYAPKEGNCFVLLQAVTKWLKFR